MGPLNKESVREGREKSTHASWHQTGLVQRISCWNGKSRSYGIRVRTWTAGTSPVFARSTGFLGRGARTGWEGAPAAVCRSTPAPGCTSAPSRSRLTSGERARRCSCKNNRLTGINGRINSCVLVLGKVQRLSPPKIKVKKCMGVLLRRTMLQGLKAPWLSRQELAHAY